MTVHLQRQIDKLKQKVLELGSAVEKQLAAAVRCVERMDVDGANRVVEADAQINQMEVDIEEECLHTLALHQPVAFDLRFVVSVLKMNNDLERIADLAANIAEQAIFLAGEPPVDKLPYDLPLMADLVELMLRDAMGSVLQVDAELARKVIRCDDRVDEMHRAMYRQTEKAMRENARFISQHIHFMIISRQLERIADQSVNIAEDVLYMIEGRIMRHKSEAPEPAVQVQSS